MLFIDSHAHLNDPAFDQDRYTLISTLLPQAGLASCAEIGCSPEEWQPALDLTARYPGFIYPVLGVHPEYAPLVKEEHWAQLKNLLPRAVAVGEIGLDYTCLDVSNKTLQQNIFTKMLALAKEVNKPIVLHVRREGEDYSAYDDTFAMLKQNWHPYSSTAYPGVLHCFCARYEEAARALDHGLLLGINGCFTYKKNEYIREAVKKAGLDKIILETDCPYLSPQGKRGLRNDPSNIPLLAQWIADYFDVSVEEVARVTTLNTKKLYGLS